MFNRQKVLLEFLTVASRPVSKYQLTKWSFLLRHECSSAGGASFYDYVPYQFGPFSFGLFQELDKLQSTCYVHPVGENLSIGDQRLAKTIALESRSVATDVRIIVSKFGNRSTKDLTDYVYNKYPEYTCNSRLRQLTARPVAKPAIYTAGYEGRSIDSFLNLLVQSGIQRLIDIRRNPIARRYGFHRSTLKRLCERLSIEYIHFPGLGIATEERRNLNDEADYKSLFDNYKRSTLREESATLQTVTSLMIERASVLVCMENDPNFCHRSAVAAEIAKLSGLPICNLGCVHECRRLSLV